VTCAHPSFSTAASITSPVRRSTPAFPPCCRRCRKESLPSFVIRDQALALSGLLVGTLGGPPVKPYQPEGIWAEATFDKKQYRRDSGEKLYRRSLYTFWRRIVGPTMFFDAARRQTCTVDVQLKNTPLHALTTLNDVTYAEEVDILRERLAELRADYREHADEAEKLVGVGEAPQRAQLDPEEHAAWTVLCSMILNLDEVLTRE